ncbi:MAG: hypothetical protein ACLSAJ_04240 [Intestinibacter bartlettii]|uniref:hypothetical protein n=1 Tax=Intestinibacter bartlettii TaxID=261299 RepID=UPI0039A124E1
MLKKYKKIAVITIGVIAVAMIADILLLNLKNNTAKEENNPGQAAQITTTNEIYKVRNIDIYQQGRDNYYNIVRKEKELWQMQSSIPMYFDGFIEKAASENNTTISDMMDYIYAGIVAIRDETKENLSDLNNNNANSQIIEYEKNILAFIDNVIQNYNLSYKISEADKTKYFEWIEAKKEIPQDINIDKEDDYIEKDAKIKDIYVKEDSQNDTDIFDNGKIHLNIKFGEFVEAFEDEDLLVVKAKIKPAYSNTSTINQNAFNVQHIIKEQDGDKYKEIQYWAVADMTDGSESKVISFTLGEDVIKAIKNERIAGTQIIDYATDVWILPSLKN